MTDYLKIAKEKITTVGEAIAKKTKEAAEAAAKLVTGNDGGLGKAKGAITNREKQLEDGMVNGGKVGRKKRRL